MTFKEFLSEAVDKTKETRSKTELKAAEWLKNNGFTKEKKKWNKGNEEFDYSYIDPTRKLTVEFLRAGNGAETFFVFGKNDKDGGDFDSFQKVKTYLKKFDAEKAK